MSAEATAKLQNEMDADKDNAYVQYIGQFLLSHLAAHPEDADKILAADKTIAKSLDAMRAAAEKKRKGNVAVLTPDEGFKIVLEYFGIQGAAPATLAPEPVSPKAPAPAPAVSGFDVKLEDFGL